jgi:Flp pilus assembly protein TadG
MKHSAEHTNLKMLRRGSALKTLRRGSALKTLRCGSALLEFTLLGIPVLFLFTSVITCSIDMWQFYTLSYAVEMTSRYAGMHGATCGGTNTCTINSGAVTSYLVSQAIALDKSLLNVTLTDGSGSTTCNPVTTCTSGTAQFPAAAYNSVGANITVTATYRLVNPIAMLWPGSSGVNAGTFTVGATSTQGIVY